MRAMEWRGSNALVCGASAGLGYELTLQLAKAGVAKLGVLARGQEGIERLSDEIRANYPGVELLCFLGDISDGEQALRIESEVRQGIPELDLVINAVGKSDRGAIAALQPADLEGLFRTNVLSSLNVVQGFAPLLERRRGTLVLVGSLASLFAPRFLGGYAISKHAVAALAQQARLELKEKEVHVMLACPGPIRRADAGKRYQQHASQETPAGALQPGGGAKLKGLDPEQLAVDILRCAARKKRTMIRPRKARLLVALNSIWPSLAEAILRRRTA